jgi:Domain of unknown function (DUF4412)
MRRSFVLVLVLVLGGCKSKSTSATADGGTSTTGGGILSSLLGSDFEGEITAKATGRSSNKTTILVFGLKSPKVRIDTSGDLAPTNPMLSQGAALIADPPNKKGILLVPGKKQAVELDFDKLKGMRPPTIAGMKGPDMPAAPSQNQPPPTIDKTGKKDTVAGYSCEIWKITESTGRHADVCVADGITWIDLTDLGMSSPELATVAALGDMNHFPLRAVAYDEKNVEEGRFEATKIEKKTLDDARFAVPPGYQTVDITQLFQGLSGGTPGHGPQPPLRRPGNH